MSDRSTRICLGAFAGAHGVKGEALVKTFTQAAENIAAYGPLQSEDRARQFTLTVRRRVKPDLVIVAAPEIKSREDAQNLKGVRLFAERASLPETAEDEFYLEDLIGLQAVDEKGAPLGRISAVYNFGAGDLIEISDIPGVGEAQLLPFTKQIAPEIDIKAGRITLLREALALEGESEKPSADPDFVLEEMRQRDA